MTRQTVGIWRLLLTLLVSGVAGLGLVLTSLSANSDHLTLSTSPVYLPLVLKAYDPASTRATATPTPTATSTPTPTATPTATPTPTSTPAGAAVVISSSYFIQTVGAQTMLYIVGELYNAASAPIESVMVTATLYSGSGAPIGSAQASTLKPLLGPGQKSAFKIAAERPSGFAHYALGLAYAFSTQPPLEELTILHASNHQDQLSGWRYFFGEVQNTTAAPFTKGLVISTFYDAAGKVINVETASLFHDALEAGEASPFRLVLALGPAAFASQAWSVVYTPAQRPAYHGLPLLSRTHVRDSWQVEGDNGTIFTLQSLDIFGEFRNDTGQPIHKARVIGTFYDKAGTVINALSTHYPVGLRYILAPDERGPFHLRLDAGPIPQDDHQWVFDVIYEPATTQPLPRVPTLSSTTYREQRFEQQGDETVLVSWVDIVGEIGNDLAASLKSARVVGTFYNTQGVVINVAAASVYRRIVPAGQQSPFKLPISFGPLDWDNMSLTVDYQTSMETSISGLEIASHRAEQSTTLKIIGELRNGGTQTLQAPQVIATLYNAAGVVINVGRLRLADQVTSGQNLPFTLEFASHFQGWTRYELYTDATY